MSVLAISPLDGRYQSKTEALAPYVSEWALMKYRVRVEIAWLLKMSQTDAIADMRALTDEETAFLEALAADFDEAANQEIKTIERTTNHDVKAVEYYIKNAIAGTSLEDVSEFVHFCCTSEDINNLSYALMMRDAIHEAWLPGAAALLDSLSALAVELADAPMLARTHGQPATPTTLGKELGVFVFRLKRQLKQIEAQEFLGKFNGAVGAYNAHLVAYPDADWVAISRSLVEGLGLTHNPMTTQIESHDYMAELFHTLTRFNTVLLDLCRDMWTYISLGYFKQQVVAGEVGSSTMPHKVNPINFENAEANLGLSNAVLGHLAEKLPVSRLQRDLSDSSALRNGGTGIAYSYLAMTSALRGLERVAVDRDKLGADLDDAWEVLSEAVQTILRKNGVENPYEKLKELTRGAAIQQKALTRFVASLEIPQADKDTLLKLTPGSYIGIAPQLAREVVGS